MQTIVDEKWASGVDPRPQSVSCWSGASRDSNDPRRQVRWRFRHGIRDLLWCEPQFAQGGSCSERTISSVHCWSRECPV